MIYIATIDLEADCPYDSVGFASYVYWIEVASKTYTCHMEVLLPHLLDNIATKPTLSHGSPLPRLLDNIATKPTLSYGKSASTSIG